MAELLKHGDWIIFYSNEDPNDPEDYNTYSSKDGPPEKAPKEHVQCIVVIDRSCGAYIMSEQNYYCWHEIDNEWVPHDNQGLEQYNAAPYTKKIVLSGYWISKKRYGNIRSIALKDPRVPTITAEPPREPEGI